MAAGDIRFIDAEDALTVLTSNQQKSVPALIAKYASIGAGGLGIALAIANGRANAGWVNGLSIGANIAPGLVNIATGQVPPIAPLVSATHYPVTLAAGACMTDHWFAGKMKNPQVRTATIGADLQPSVPAPAPKPTTGARFELSAMADIRYLSEDRTWD